MMTSSRPEELLSPAAAERGVCAIGTWQNVVVIVWWTAGNGPAAEQLARVTARMRETHPEKVSHIHLLKNLAGLPSSAARSTLVKIMREHGEGIANCAVVVGGTGFWASTMRSAITNMRMLAPGNFEMRLHASPVEIVEWLPRAHTERTGVTLAPDMLVKLLQQAEVWLDDGRVAVPY